MLTTLGETRFATGAKLVDDLTSPFSALSSRSNLAGGLVLAIAIVEHSRAATTAALERLRVMKVDARASRPVSISKFAIIKLQSPQREPHRPAAIKQHSHSKGRCQSLNAFDIPPSHQYFSPMDPLHAPWRIQYLQAPKPASMEN